MKEPIRWHEECLKNAKTSLDNRREAYMSYVNRERAAIEKLSKDNDTYEAQIEAAKTQKKDGFDRNRFNIKLRRFGATTQTKDGKTPYGVTEILAPDIKSARRMLEKRWKVIRVSEVKE